MLSILIPLYNYDASQLVTQLHQQCVAENVEFEICLLDDDSIDQIKQKNRTVANLPNIIYKELPQNVGRSVIRNLLAQQAKHPYLLFIDCDAKLFSKTFIKDYLSVAQPEIVACGGVVYDKYKPDSSICLRWYYGHRYESRSISERKKNSWQSFSLFNTLIDKKLFLSIQCNELLKKYGHEDTFLGCMLEQERHKIIHINNPLLHLGLNTNGAFLLKTKEGISNLLQIADCDEMLPLRQQSDLLKTLKKLRTWYLIKPFALCYRLFGQTLESFICAYPQNTRIFQLIKLLYAANLTNKKAQ